MYYCLLYSFEFLFLEFIHRITNTKALDYSMLSSFLYCFFLGFLFGFINSRITAKYRKGVFIFLASILGVYCGITIVIFKVFGITFSFESLAMAKNFTGDFLTNTFSVIFKNLWLIGLCLIPVLTVFYISKRISDLKEGHYSKVFSFVMTLLFVSLFFLSMFMTSGKDVYEQYFVKNSYVNSSRTLGILPATFVSARKKLTGFKEKVSIIEDEVTEDVTIEYVKHKKNIPFDTVEGDETIKTMNSYFKNEQGTYTNEYTGMFEGKNLIYIMAESFDGYMVDKNITPTLYKMIHQGFDFTEYYSPTNLSTIGGEFSLITGLLPDLTCLNYQWIKVTPRYDNYYPYGLADVFKRLYYSTYAYHNHEYNFQSRDVYLESQGFDNYLGCFNGLEKRMACTIFPKSDDEMILSTYEDYINDDHFMVYYVTVSGHAGWQFGFNDMADKNRELVEDLPYSTIVKGYIAANLELEKAMSDLLRVLEENNRLEDTVIILAADHHPYFMEQYEIEEMAKQKLDQFSLYKNNLIIYNCDVEHTVIDKPCNTIDVIPTMFNLFNIDYDSRLIIGKDILSDSDGLVIYADYSWLTDKGKYSSTTRTFTPFKEFEGMDEYAERMNSIVNTKYLMSEYIMKYDYYRKIKDYLN